MNNILGIVGLGAIAWYLYNNNISLQERLKKELDDLSGRITDANDKLNDIDDEFNNSSIRAEEPDIIIANIKKTLKAGLVVIAEYGADKEWSRFELSFKNNSDNSYTINRVKAYLTICGYDTDLFVPGNKNKIAWLPKQTYKMVSEWQGLGMYQNNMTMDNIISALENLNHIVPNVNNLGDANIDDLSKITDRNICSAEINIEIELNGSKQPRTITLEDIPVDLQICSVTRGKGNKWDTVAGGNALQWSESEFDF